MSHLVGWWLGLTLLGGPSPEAVDQAARAAASRPQLHYRELGRSPEGRPIGLVVATAGRRPLADMIRVLILARQHGDEPAPAEAALLWLRTEGAEAWRFDRVAVFLVPTVNPDGAAVGRRQTPRGIDLNRDWETRRAPETRLIQDLFDRWQFHVVVDLHAFAGVVAGQRRADDWLEIMVLERPDSQAFDTASRTLLDELIARQRAAGEPVRAVVSRPGAALDLAHRHFAARRRAISLLVEVGDGRADPEARVVSLLLDHLGRHAAVLKPRYDALRGLAGRRLPKEFDPPAPAPMPTPEPPAPTPPPGLPLVWPLAGYALVMLAGAKSGGGEDDKE